MLNHKYEQFRGCQNDNTTQKRRIVRKDGGARSNMAGIICTPLSE